MPIMKHFTTLLHTSTFQRWLIVLALLALPGLVQAGSPLSSLEAGVTLTPGVSYLHRSQPFPEGMTYQSGWSLSGGITISLPVSQSWQVTSGLQMVHLRYVYRLSQDFVLNDQCLRQDATHFLLHPVYLSVPLLVQRTIASHQNHAWYLIAGTRIYQRLHVFDPADNLLDLLWCKIFIDTGPLYHQRLVSLVGGLGYARNILSRWQLQVSLLAEYGIRTFIASATGFIISDFTNTRVVSILPQVQIHYRF